MIVKNVGKKKALEWEKIDKEGLMSAGPVISNQSSINNARESHIKRQ
jgi:hypothetical protein